MPLLASTLSYLFMLTVEWPKQKALTMHVALIGVAIAMEFGFWMLSMVARTAVQFTYDCTCELLNNYLF